MNWLVLVLIVGLIVYLLIRADIVTECPREVLGYNCRGDSCDHSEEVAKRAKQTMRWPRV